MTYEHISKANYENLIIVSPDVGGVVRARALAKLLDDADLAIIDKRREKDNQSQVMNIIGNVKDKTCILVDDIVDTAGTICNAAEALKEVEQKSNFLCHPSCSLWSSSGKNSTIRSRRNCGD